MSGNEEPGPLKARTDLADILMQNPENTEALVTIIENELKDIKDSDVVSRISDAVESVTSNAEVSADTKDNILYWLTETTPDVRQMILVQTVERLLSNDSSRNPTLIALGRISSESNVDMVMNWVERSIMTLNQAVYVLLYPDSSDALR
ncbi:MAG: hypothetical protein RTU30_05460 [Candidatus Thorarchaeota archaeon]